jgi:PilZ domain
MAAKEQRQYPRLGLGLPVTLMLLGRGDVSAELQDISRGGCFFKSGEAVPVDRRISVVLSTASGSKTVHASGRVVRTVAYKGFAVLFDEDDGGAIEEFIRDLTPLAQEGRAALLSSTLKPEIQIY